MVAIAFPKQVRTARARRERVVGARPILARGGDPFTLIMRTLRELADDEALHLMVGFEPTPLYAVMRAQGRAAHTEREDGVYHVWFYRDSRATPEKRPAAEPRALPADRISPHAGCNEPKLNCHVAANSARHTRLPSNTVHEPAWRLLSTTDSGRWVASP